MWGGGAEVFDLVDLGLAAGVVEGLEANSFGVGDGAEFGFGHFQVKLVVSADSEQLSIEFLIVPAEAFQQPMIPLP